jgi:hypothetical protein
VTPDEAKSAPPKSDTLRLTPPTDRGRRTDNDGPGDGADVAADATGAADLTGANDAADAGADGDGTLDPHAAISMTTRVADRRKRNIAG